MSLPKSLAAEIQERGLKRSGSRALNQLQDPEGDLKRGLKRSGSRALNQLQDPEGDLKRDRSGADRAL